VVAAAAAAAALAWVLTQYNHGGEAKLYVKDFITRLSKNVKFLPPGLWFDLINWHRLEFIHTYKFYCAAYLCI